MTTAEEPLLQALPDGLLIPSLCTRPEQARTSRARKAVPCNADATTRSTRTDRQGTRRRNPSQNGTRRRNTSRRSPTTSNLWKQNSAPTTHRATIKLLTSIIDIHVRLLLSPLTARGVTAERSVFAATVGKQTGNTNAVGDKGLVFFFLKKKKTTPWKKRYPRSTVVC